MASRLGQDQDTAIILAMFGVSNPAGLPGILGIWRSVRASFASDVLLVFTSNIIRDIWRKRSLNQGESNSSDFPVEILNVKGILGAIGDLQNRGVANIVIQPTYLCHGEQYEDLLSYVQAINSIKTVKEKWMPFKRPIAVGRPLTGTWGPSHPYRDDLVRVAEALRPQVERARDMDAALVYMGHGNRYMACGIYHELESIMSGMYPDVPVFIGTVEGFPGIESLLNRIKIRSRKDVLLYPLMIVAGEHATNDMAGSSPTSWKNILKSNGYKVTPVFEGLGELESVQQMFVSHIDDAAKDVGINLCRLENKPEV